MAIKGSVGDAELENDKSQLTEKSSSAIKSAFKGIVKRRMTITKM